MQFEPWVPPGQLSESLRSGVGSQRSRIHPEHKAGAGAGVVALAFGEAFSVWPRGRGSASLGEEEAIEGACFPPGLGSRPSGGRACQLPASVTEK